MRHGVRSLILTTICITAMLPRLAPAAETTRLDNTQPLLWTDDIASRMVAGVDRFLLRKLDASGAGRGVHWHRDMTSPRAYTASVAANRARLARQIGLREKRASAGSMTLVATVEHSALIAESARIKVYAVRWPVVRRMHSEGLLLVPKRDKPVADVVAIPDADQTPEMICGIAGDVPAESQFARLLAESGCRVLVPTLIDRRMKPRGGRAVLSSREYLYRSAYELGHHLIGYEVQKILAGVAWFTQSPGDSAVPVGVIGWGEGGMLALYAAALDSRIGTACVSGYFGPREAIWKQPIDRNVFGLLDEFGDAEIASLIAPRKLVVEAARAPELTLVGKGGAPAELVTPALAAVQSEVNRARALTRGLPTADQVELVVSAAGHGPFLTKHALDWFLADLTSDANTVVDASPPTYSLGHPPIDATKRQDRLVREIDDHNQWLLRESPYVREAFMNKLDTSSIQKFRQSVAWYRDYFRDEVIGHFTDPLLAPNPRTRQAYHEAKWTGYEVVLDVFPDVIAYGILLLPNDLKPGQRRPVVVCQHGLEGRPQQLVSGNHRAYHDFAAKLAEQGFITFAPQNLYIFGDRFRTLQRKTYPLKKTLFSVMVPQHQQILNWLKSLPYVDPSRIAFYGLSYGGKSAMRIPALVDDYCLSICSGDFNEWVWKNASTRSKYSYVWTGEYEMFEFDLGSTFNYAEMATLIAPRPFMVERGHFDGVAPDEMVAHEFAKVRRLYQARLNLPQRCAIEWFNGPHMINGKGTFDFLHQQLEWKQRAP